MTECAGVGTCDRQTGRCVCPAIYTGEACETSETTPDTLVLGVWEPSAD